MAEPLTDKRLAEMRICAEQVTQPGRDHPVGERLLGRDILTLLDEIERLRAKNAAMVKTMAELADALLPFAAQLDPGAPDHGPADGEPFPDAFNMTTWGERRRAAELVARHGAS